MILSRIVINTAINLLVGLRATLFLPLSLASLRVSWGQWLLLMLLDVLMLFLRDFGSAHGAGEFDANGLVGALFPVSLLLATAVVLSYRVQQSWRTLPLLLAFTSQLLVIDTLCLFYPALVTQLTDTSAISSWYVVVYYLPTIWLVATATVTAIRILEFRPRQWPAALLACSLFIGLPMTTLWFDRTLWLATEIDSAEDEFASASALITEEAFYRQPKLLAQQLDQLQAQRPGVTDLYLLSVAGYANQDVFKKEALAVEQLFSERFDTAGRSLHLINNSDTLSSEAVASLTSVRAALKTLGEVIDREEDIVFVFLTSHGSAETGFSLEFWPFALNNLKPEHLRDALDSAGIKHRVLVVSACYAGTFVEPLRNDHSLIITAAAADRNSFGCSNEADYTYFGKAYFDEALRTTLSFGAAFEQAKRRIAEREQRDGYESSNPQLSMGRKIGQKLVELEQRLLETSAAEKPIVKSIEVSSLSSP